MQKENVLIFLLIKIIVKGEKKMKRIIYQRGDAVYESSCNTRYTFKTFIWEKVIRKNKKYTQNNPLKL